MILQRSRRRCEAEPRFRHPATLAWQNSRALGADVVASLRELKRGDGPDLLTQGSADQVRQLLATDVVDELRLLVHPILLGRGKRLLDDTTQASAFRLEESKAAPTAVVVNCYVRDGAVRTGTFGHD